MVDQAALRAWLRRARYGIGSGAQQAKHAWRERPRSAPGRHGGERWQARREKGFRLVDRLDPVWGAMALALVLAVMLAGTLMGFLRGQDQAWEQVEDTRILASYTRDKSCVEAVATDPGGGVQVALSTAPDCQDGLMSGGVVRHDPKWRIWGHDLPPFGPDGGAIRPETLARLGDRVWVHGAEGGLAVLDRGDWTTWLAQSTWRVAGRPVRVEDIALVASAPDGRLTLLVHRGGASALYDAEHAAWHPMPDLPGRGRLLKLVWQDRQLWILREGELWRITIGDSLSDRPEAWPAPQHLARGRFVSMTALAAAEPQPASVFVVEHPACGFAADRAARCLRVTRWHGEGDGATPLLDNTAAPSRWTARDVSRVASVGRYLLLAGDKGLWRYDIVARSWHRITDKPVTLLEQAPPASAGEGRRVAAFGGPGWLGALQLDTRTGEARSHLVDRKSLGEAERVAPVAVGFDPAGQPLFSDAQGSLLRLTLPEGKLALLFRRTAPVGPFQPIRTLAGDKRDIFVTEDRIWAVERVQRRYQSAALDKNLLRSLAEAPRGIWHGDVFFAFSKVSEGDTGRLLRLDATALETLASRDIGPTRDLAALDARRVLRVDGAGRLGLVQFQDDGSAERDMMPAQPKGGPSADTLTDVAAQGQVMFLASPDGIRAYDGARRAWWQVAERPVRALSVLSDGGGLVALQDSGAIVRHDVAPLDPNESPPAPVTLLRPAQLGFDSDAALFDTRHLPDGRLAFLYGRGGAKVGLTLYDPTQRRVSKSWTIQRRGADQARLVDVFVDEIPVWLAQVDGRLYTPSGQVSLADGAEAVADGWFERADGGTGFPIAIVAVEIDSRSQRRFLHRIPLAAAAMTAGRAEPVASGRGCLLRGADRAARPFEDGLRDTAGRLILRGAGRLELRLPEDHYWMTADLPWLRSDTPLALWQDALWLRLGAEEGGPSLARIDLSRLPAKASGDNCAPTAPRLSAQRYERAVVRRDGAALFQLDGKGSIERHDLRTGFEGQYSTLQQPTALSPGIMDASMPQRVLFHDGGLWFAFGQSLHHYDLASRQWRRVAVLADDPPQAQVLLHAGEGPNAGRIVASWMDHGRWQQVSAPLRPAEGARAPVLRGGELRGISPLPEGLNAASLRDIRQTDKLLLFRFDGRLAALDRAGMDWAGHWPLPRDATRFLLLKQRLFALDGTGRRLWMKRVDGTGWQTEAPVEMSLPEGAELVFADSGFPAWLTRSGGLVTCNARGVCDVAIATPPAVDLSVVDRAMALPGGAVLLQDRRGRGALLTPEGFAELPQRLGEAVQTDPNGALASWMTQPVGALRVLRDPVGRVHGVVMSDAQGREWPLGAVPDALGAQEISDQASGNILRLNVEQGLALTPAGEVRKAGQALAQLPPATDLNALRGFGLSGQGDDQELWVQVGRDLFSAPLACLSAQDTAQTCEQRRIRLPRRVGRVAMADLSVDTAWVVTLEDGSRLGKAASDWTWGDLNDADAPDMIPLQSLKADWFHERPDGRLSLSPGAGWQGDVAPTAPVLRARAQPGGDLVVWRRPVGLRLPAMDLGWLRFDEAVGRIVVDGENGRTVDLRLPRAFDEDGRFKPLAWSSPAPQPDGSLLVRSGVGQLRLTDQPGIARVLKVGLRPWDRIAPDRPVADRGGFWTGARFHPFDQAPAPQLQRDGRLERAAPGAVALMEDPRKPGVRMKLDGVPVLGASGLLWDQIDDIGLDPVDQLVLKTPLGPLLQQAPWNGRVSGRLTWSGQSFDRIAADGERPDPRLSAALKWVDGPNGRRRWLVEDDLIALRPVGAEIGVLTGEGLRLLPDLKALVDGLATPIPSGSEVALAGRFDRLQAARSHPGLLAWRGQEAWLLDQGRIERLPAALGPRERSDLLWQVGPLLALEGNEGPALRLQDATGGQMPALDAASGTFRFDQITDLELAPDGSRDIYLISKAGVLVAPGGAMALEHLRIERPARSETSHLLIRRNEVLYLLDVADGRIAECRRLDARGAAPCASGEQIVGQATAQWPVAQGDGVHRLRVSYTAQGRQFLWQPAEGQPSPTTLHDGGFSHDRFRLALGCGAQLHLIDEDARHMVLRRALGQGRPWASGRSGGAATASRILTLPAGQRPAELYCAPAGIGRQGGEEHPILLSDQGQVYHLLPVAEGGEGWRVSQVSAARSATYLAWIAGLTPASDASDGRGERAHLYRHGPHGGLGAQPGGDLAELLRFAGSAQADLLLRHGAGEQTAGVPLVDRPRLFVPLAGQILAVTDEAVVPFGATDAAQAALAPGAGRRLPLPMACQVTELRQLTQQEAILFCDSGASVLLRASSGDGVTFSVQPGGARRPEWLAEAGALHLQAHPAQGMIDLTLAGEALGASAFAVSVGQPGFTFDQIQALHGDGQGNLHVVGADGWRLYHGGSLALTSDEAQAGPAGLSTRGQALRMAAPVLSSLRKVEATHLNHVLCLQLDAETAIWGTLAVSAGQEVPPMALSDPSKRQCRSFLGQDRLRTHWRDAAGRYRPNLTLSENDRPEDVFLLGGFGSDRAGGLPDRAATGADGQTDPETVSYCALSDLDGVAILAEGGGAPRRVAASRCTPFWQVAPPHADGHMYRVFEGQLFKRAGPPAQ